MPKFRLTAAFCAAAECQTGKRKTDYWDTVTTGFVLEVRESGGRTYYLRYFDAAGRQRAHRIANHSDVSFAEAAKAARRLRSEVVLGGDPLAVKKEKRAIGTYADLARQHQEFAKATQRSWWSVDGIIRKHLLPRWGRMRLDEITSQAISLWLAEKAADDLKPATVEKIRAVLGRSFELGRQWGVPGAERNPVRGVKIPKFDNKRSLYLSVGDAERLLCTAERSSQPQLKPLIQLALLTGARKSELFRAEWQHVDLERRSWLIPMSKTGKARHVPLSQSAVDVLTSLPRLPGCPFVLPNLATGTRFRDVKKAWDTVRREACLPDLRIHDLRHSAASFMINAGVDLYAVGRVLGHADHQSTMRYSHLANDTLLAAVEAGAAKMGGGAKQP